MREFAFTNDYMERIQSGCGKNRPHLFEQW